MASTLNTSIKLLVEAKLSSAIGLLPVGLTKVLNWGSGTGQDQSDLVYAKDRTVTNSGTPDTIDLSGSLVMADGAAAVFVEVTSIIIVHLGTTVTDDANILTVGGGSNPFISWLAATGDGVKIRNGGFFAIGSGGDTTGYAVTAGTGDILQVSTAAGTNVPYLILITGRSA